MLAYTMSHVLCMCTNRLLYGIHTMYAWMDEDRRRFSRYQIWSQYGPLYRSSSPDRTWDRVKGTEQVSLIWSTLQQPCLGM